MRVRWPVLLLPLLVLVASVAPGASAAPEPLPCEEVASLCVDDECVLENPGAALDDPVGSAVACVNWTR